VPTSSNNNNNKTQPIVKPPPQPKIRSKIYTFLNFILQKISKIFIYYLDEIQESDAFMEALGNVSTTSRSLNKPTFNKNKIVKKESINESIKTTATIIDEKPISKLLNDNNNVNSTDKINELKNENNLYKSNLAEPTLKKLNKKKVLWADTHTNGSKQLEIVQYFYLDEIEREIKRSALTDLKNGSDIGDIGAKIEKLNEKELKFKMSPTSFNNTINTANKNINEIKNNWPSSLIPIDLPESIPIPEIKSIEHEIQLKREQNTLAVLVFKQFLPDSPSEPNESDNLTNKTNPLDFYPTKIIPFDDATLNVQSDMDNQIHYNPAKDCNNDKFYSKQQQQQQKRQQFQNEQSLLKLNKDLATPLNFRPDLTLYPDTPVSLVSTPILTEGLNSFQVSATNKDSSDLINSVSNETLKQILNTINNKKADSSSSSSNTPATTSNLQDLLNTTKIASDINNGILNIDGFNRNDNQRKNSNNLNNFGISKQFDNDELKNNLLPKNSQKWNNNNHGWSKNNNGQRFFNKNDNNNSQQRNFQNNSVEIGSSSSIKDNSDDNSTNDNNNRNIFSNKFKRGIGNRPDVNRPNNNNNHFRQQTSEYTNYKNTFQNKGNNNHKGNFRPDFNRNHFDNDKSSEPEVFNNNSNKNKESKNLTKNSNEFKSAGKWM
jgi:hypothetical protein